MRPFERGDFSRMEQCLADVVEPVEQPMPAEGIDLEHDRLAGRLMGVPDFHEGFERRYSKPPERDIAPWFLLSNSAEINARPDPPHPPTSIS